MIGISSGGPGWFAEMCERHSYAETPVLAPEKPRPEPIQEPVPEPEKSLEQQLEEMEQRFLNPVTPQLEKFVRLRNEEQLRQAELAKPSGRRS